VGGGRRVGMERGGGAGAWNKECGGYEDTERKGGNGGRRTRRKRMTKGGVRGERKSGRERWMVKNFHVFTIAASKVPTPYLQIAVLKLFPLSIPRTPQFQLLVPSEIFAQCSDDIL